MSKIFDALTALVFLTVSFFGMSAAYSLVRYAALTQIRHGLKSTYQFQRSIDGLTFDWER